MFKLCEDCKYEKAVSLKSSTEKH